MPTCLRTSRQVLDEVRVAGVEPDSHAGQVGALRQRVHGDHTVETMFEDRTAPSSPRELHVALVGEHGDAVPPAPCRGGAQVVDGAGRVAGAVDPQCQRSRRIGRVDRRQVQPSGLREWDGHGAASGQRGTHLVGRVGDRRVQHGVEVGSAQPQPLRQRAHELLRADARRRMGGIHGEVEAALDPACDRPPQGGGADAGRVTALAVRCGQRLDHGRRGRVTRRPDRQVDHATGEPGGERLEPVDPLVRVRRRYERLRMQHRRRC